MIDQKCYSDEDVPASKLLLELYLVLGKEFLACDNDITDDEINAFTSYLKTQTEKVDLTLSSKKPTKTGYNFHNWTASIGGMYNPGGKYIHDQEVAVPLQQYQIIGVPEMVRFHLP